MSNTTSVLKEVSVSQIKTNGNVRTVTNALADKELAQSVKDKGVIEPIIIRKEDNILIAGHRRLDAAKKAGHKQIPARIMDVTKEEALEIQVIENLQRKDLTPLEEAEAYAQLMDNNGKEPVWDHKGKKVLPSGEFNKRVSLLAKSIGKNKTHVLRVLRLIELPKTVKKWIGSGKLTAMHGALLVDLPEMTINSVIAKFLAGKISNLQAGDVFPVSDLKYYIETNFNKHLSNAIFPTDSDYAGEQACTTCPYNSGNAMSLFGSGELGACRQNKCWKKKTDQVFRDVKEKFQGKAPLKGLKKVRFGGYASVVTSYGAADRVPFRIKNQIVLPIKTTTTQKFEKILADNQDVFKFCVVKPSEPKKNPLCQLVFVTTDIERSNKLLGLKMKPINSQGAEQSHEDHERNRYVQNFIDNVIKEKAQVAIKSLKPSKQVTLVYFASEFDNNSRAFEEASEVLGIKIPKAKKGTHPFELMDLHQVGLLALGANVIYNEDYSVLGLDEKAIAKEFEKPALEAYAKAQAIVAEGANKKEPAKK